MQDEPDREPGSSSRSLSTPHDRLFKRLLGDPVRATDFLQMHLPVAIRKLLSDKPPVLVDGNFVDETLGLRQSDLLYRVELRTGKEAFVYVLLEHLSKPDPRIPLRLATYILRIWERHAETTPDGRLLLRPVIPFVVYNGQRTWNVPFSLFELVDAGEGPLRELVQSFGYRVADLGRMPERRLARNRGLLGGFLAMVHAYRHPVAVRMLVRILHLLPDGSDLEQAALEYIFAVYSIEWKDLASAAREAKPDRWEVIMGTIAEDLLQRGEARGIELGEARGIELGEARGRVRVRTEILARLLERRFGPLPAGIRKRIDGAAQEQLDTWLEAVLDAPELKAVFRTSS